MTPMRYRICELSTYIHLFIAYENVDVSRVYGWSCMRGAGAGAARARRFDEPTLTVYKTYGICIAYYMYNRGAEW